MTNNPRANAGARCGSDRELLSHCRLSHILLYLLASANCTKPNILQDATVQNSPLLCPHAPHLTSIDLPPESGVDVAEASTTVRSGECDEFIDVLLLRNVDERQSDSSARTTTLDRVELQLCCLIV
jgi:hypothetical protein